ncbi:molybdopterin molybdotransferase MoeA [Desulfosarcina ovata]|uniref:Molybdopterin molybdenumtransferase n=2 Tax=Desulfosarcina ovata TaxID=83564 RepID=A0A5K8AK54_9BACT|nr:molybdopterin molybdotransferase MoeA [Desulfosarcina ovata]BBO86031.1 molybdopterin molybdenumtransferase MoeA [Desulfosarcina ovata subsp. sediminis]BBO92968.1 molybdopterin molybdenumtransferase MoeA [Desulfosarcina ovata subsp. ovata]
MNKVQMGYDEALKVTLETIAPLGIERIALSACTDRIVAEDLRSTVNSPSIHASMKDGYAVRSDEIEHASPKNQVRLRLIGVAAAGGRSDQPVTGGTAIRILTGAKIPEGADAVLAEEFTSREGDMLTVFNNAHPGRNILPKGADVAENELVASRGSRLSPGMLGILAAAGYSTLPVYRQPRLAILATGDELVVPGHPLPDGKLYASNLEMLNGWCQRYGMRTTFAILSDRPDTITAELAERVKSHDALITSGGAWTGDRDYVAEALGTLGWEKYFHWIRMGPGKPVGFGLLEQKPIFLLPGGPPSNLTAFLQIALPGLLALGGNKTPSLPRIMVKLADTLTSRQTDWTEFVYGVFRSVDGHALFDPLRGISRLKALARAEGVVAIPEGVKSLPAGTVVSVQLLV